MRARRELLAILSLLAGVENVCELVLESVHIIVDGMEGAILGGAFVDAVAVDVATDIVVIKVFDDILDILPLCRGHSDFGVVLYFHNFYFPFL